MRIILPSLRKSQQKPAKFTNFGKIPRTDHIRFTTLTTLNLNELVYRDSDYMTQIKRGSTEGLIQ